METPSGSYKEASNDFNDPTEASKSVIVCCFPAMRLLSWNSAHRGRWHGKKTQRILCFAHVLLIANRYCFNQIPKSSDKDDVLGWQWCFEAAQDDLMSGLAAVVGFPRLKNSNFRQVGGVGIWDSETPKDIESNPPIPSFWLHFWYFFLL